MFKSMLRGARRPLVLLAGAVALGGPALPSQALADATPQPTKPVDLQRLAGHWFEIARVPNIAESDCPVATTDWLAKPDGKFQVTQTCRKSEASPPGRTIRAMADPLDPVANTKWRMNYFGGLIRRDYWVMDHAPDGAWVIMAMPGKKYVWVLCRQADTPPAMRDALAQRVAALGYDASRLVFPFASEPRGG